LEIATLRQEVLHSVFGVFGVRYSEFNEINIEQRISNIE
jgi:hypothetical protein